MSQHALKPARSMPTREYKRVALPWVIACIPITGGPIALAVAGVHTQIPHLDVLLGLGLLYCAAMCIFIALWFRKRPMRIRPGPVVRCVSCLYPAEPSFDRCSECGADLRKAGATVRGELASLGNSGAVCLLLVSLIMMGLVFFLFWAR